jgi:hypothetical protein
VTDGVCPRRIFIRGEIEIRKSVFGRGGRGRDKKVRKRSGAAADVCVYRKRIGVSGNSTGCFDCAPAAAFATGRSAQHDPIQGRSSPHPQLRMSTSRRTVPIAEMINEPRQPRRFEKNANMDGCFAYQSHRRVTSLFPELRRVLTSVLRRTLLRPTPPFA